MSDIVRKIRANKDYVAEFLILNPASMAAFMRGRVGPYQGDGSEIAERIGISISNIERARNDLKAQSERDRIRLYLTSTIPTNSCVYNENVMDIGFYDELKKGAESFTWKMDNITSNNDELSLYSHYVENIRVTKSRSDTICYFDVNGITSCVAAGREQLAEYEKYINLLTSGATAAAGESKNPRNPWLKPRR